VPFPCFLKSSFVCLGVAARSCFGEGQGPGDSTPPSRLLLPGRSFPSSNRPFVDVVKRIFFAYLKTFYLIKLALANLGAHTNALALQSWCTAKMSLAFAGFRTPLASAYPKTPGGDVRLPSLAALGSGSSSQHTAMSMAWTSRPD
jgi:hypothetical protein